MTKKSYTELLRDPRWQKKRLKILERDNWTCRKCESKEKTLHVHHLYYEYGKNPWEYPDLSLSTLCLECHEEETESIKAVTGDLIKILKQRGFMSDDFHFLCSLAMRGELGGRDE